MASLTLIFTRSVELWTHSANGLVGCKVPTDLEKIGVKEATHMGFYYMKQWYALYVFLYSFFWNRNFDTYEFLPQHHNRILTTYFAAI